MSLSILLGQGRYNYLYFTDDIPLPQDSKNSSHLSEVTQAGKQQKWNKQKKRI